MTVQIVSSLLGLQMLSVEWNSLLADSTADSIFLTWEWIVAWLESVGRGVPLVVMLSRDTTGRLCGAAPFYRRCWRLLRTLPYRALCVLGDADNGSEYGNLMVRRGYEEPVTTDLMRHLLTDAASDVVWLPNMGPEPDENHSLAGAAAEAGWQVRERPAEFARVELPEEFGLYLGRLPGKIRYQMRAGLQRLDSAGVVVRSADREPDSLEMFLSELFRLHQLRWTRRGVPGLFADPRMRDFYRVLAKRMLGRGWLRLDLLWAAGRAVAAQIGFAYHGTFYELQRGFDPAYANVPAGLGAALRNRVMERCIHEGIRTYDFLGEMTEDKLRAGAVSVKGHDLIAIRPSVRTTPLLRLPLWPTGRYLKAEAL